MEKVMSDITTVAAHISPEAHNSYAVFCGTLPGAVTKLQVYAVQFYELRIDEELVAYGPCRSRAPLLYYDEYTLKAGTKPKFVALKVHARKGCPEVYVNNVQDWRVMTLTCYGTTAPKCVGEVGYSEYCDLLSSQWRWYCRDFSDPALTAPKTGRIISAAEFLKRPIPLFHENKVEPQSVEFVNGGWLVDFGRMVYGRPELKGEFRGQGTIQVSYVEALDSGWAHPEGRLEMYADRLTGDGAFGWKAFWKRPCRYIFIAGELKQLDSVCTYEYGYPVVTGAAFHCSDERLNRLWDISERTLRLCMDDIFNDCPHRDQAQWMDAFVSSKAALSLYGVTDLTRKCLLQHGLCSFKGGMLLSPSICGGGFFVDYALVYVLFLQWFWQVTGDKALLEELFANTEEGFRIFFEMEDADGLLMNADRLGSRKVRSENGFSDIGSQLYLDNTFELCRSGKSAGLNALYYGALQAMGAICDILGKPSPLYREKALKLAKSYRTLFASREAPGCFRDSDSRFEHFFHNVNFSCEFGKWTGAGATVRFAVNAPAAGNYGLLAGAYDRWRLRVNGVCVHEDRERASWQRPAPVYSPTRLTLALRAGENLVEFDCAGNNLNWELFFDLPLPVEKCEIRETDYATGSAVPESQWKQIRPRPWMPPFLSQSTNAYAAFNGLMDDMSALRQILPEIYWRNYISIRVPLFCRETDDLEKLKRWIMPANTPWTAFYLVASLFRAGMGREALDAIRRAWGVMLDRSAVNTWEEWDDNASLCHAWGASPAWFLVHDVLGIQYEKLGRKVVVIRPDLGDLEFADGAAALSADGSSKVTVSLRKTAVGTQVRLAVPPGYQVEKDYSRLANPVEIA